MAAARRGFPIGCPARGAALVSLLRPSVIPATLCHPRESGDLMPRDTEVPAFAGMTEGSRAQSSARQHHRASGPTGMTGFQAFPDIKGPTLKEGY